LNGNSSCLGLGRWSSQPTAESLPPGIRADLATRLDFDGRKP